MLAHKQQQATLGARPFEIFSLAKIPQLFGNCSGRQGSSGTGSAVPESNALSRPGTVNAAPFVPNAGVAGSSIPGAVPAAAPTNNR